MSPPRRANRGWALALAGLSGLGSSGLGCEHAPTERAPTEHAPIAVEAPIERGPSEAEHRARAEETAALVSWLREQAVREARFFAPRVLYTWTRAEQIAELRSDPTLLTRSRAANGALSAFDHALESDRSPLARHLRSARWSSRRFAWPAPWATRRGWPGADYGDRLIRVELRQEAWVARFDPDGEPRWEVRDARGELVAESAVRAEPWRVGAVYHEGHGPGPDGAERTWREYVLVSEPMVGRWSVGDDATAQRLAEDRAQLVVLAERFEALGSPAPPLDRWTRALRSRWRDEGGAELAALYESGLALGSELYLPEPARVRAIAASLETPSEAPLSHEPPPYAPRHVLARRPIIRHPRLRSLWCDPTVGCVP